MAATAPAAPALARPPAEQPAWGRWGLRLFAVTYLAVMLMLPVAVIFQDGLRGGLAGLWAAVTTPAARHALVLTLWTSALMAVINGVMGTATAYVLVRCQFSGKALLNALVDLPLAIPTLVTGVMLVVLYGPQAPIGHWLDETLGLRIIFAPPGIILALLFITFPFVVRTVQPVLATVDSAQEEAAATLGASAIVVFRRVTLPAIALPVFTGTLLSFARALGEFGAIVIVAGNIPLKSQTAAVYVLGRIESDDRAAASAISLIMLSLAFSLVLLVDWLQRPRETKP